MSTPIPTSRLGRLARVAATGLRARSGTADELAARLGELRGFAAKLGQMAGYVDGLAPDDEGWERAMGGLLCAAPTSSTEAARRAVEAELGAPLDRLFSDWEEAPFASASLGQVFRATLPDGRRVAVKVQHQGVAEAMESDLANLTLLQRAGSLLGGKVNTAAPLDELSAHLRGELDYRQEARNQERFRALHAHDPSVVVPEVIPSHSGRAVLTTTLAEGLPFSAARAAPEAARRAWCSTLWTFVYQTTVKHGLFNADPHPGNFLFQDDGRVVFLDFGCVVQVSEAQRAADEALHRAALRSDEAAFASAGRALLGLSGGGHEARALRQLRDMYEPLFASPFRISRAWSAGLLRQMRELGRAARQSPEEVPPLPPGALLMNRLQFGFYSVLARLDAEVDYAAVERAFLGP